MRNGFAGIAVAIAILALPAAASATHSGGVGPKLDKVDGAGRGPLFTVPFGTVDARGHINAKSDGVDAGGMFWIEFAGILLRGRVECLTADGNEARWGGPIERSNSAFFPAGRWVYGHDVDGGEGSNAAPDQHGGVVGGAPAEGECPTPITFPLPLTQGNLVVHDGI